jgi:hypothetical protein
MIDEALIVMTQKELRRYQIIQQILSGRLNGSVAARFLDLSVRIDPTSPMAKARRGFLQKTIRGEHPHHERCLSAGWKH